MKLFIPDIGDVIKLSAPWTFNLHYEYRCNDLLEHFGFKNNTKTSNDFEKVTLPVDTELKVDRIYIRKGAGSFSSLTFYAQIPGVKGKFKFWAKLRDVNRIETETTATTGVLKFPIKWGYDDLMVKGSDVAFKSPTTTLIGSVNGTDAFKIFVSHYETQMVSRKDYWDKKEVKEEIVSKIKYKLICLLSGDEVGEWTTVSTMKNKAKDYIQSNLKYFIDDEQRVALREEKLERVLKNE